VTVVCQFVLSCIVRVYYVEENMQGGKIVIYKNFLNRKFAIN
jgi:hypothetical protein